MGSPKILSCLLQRKFFHYRFICVIKIADESLYCRRFVACPYTVEGDALRELTGLEIIGEAADGNEAMIGISELNPDVVTLDIRMPDQNGLEVLKNIRTNNPDTVVIVLTNFPYPQYRKKCMKLRAKYFFDKSNEFERVRNVLEQLIRDTQT